MMKRKITVFCLILFILFERIGSVPATASESVYRHVCTDEKKIALLREKFLV